MEILTGEVELSDLTSRAKIVLINVSSQWCGPCKKLTPILEEFEKTVGDDVKILKIDVTNGAPKFVMDLGIRQVPVILVYKDGVLKLNEVGSKSKETLAKIIEDLS